MTKTTSGILVLPADSGPARAAAVDLRRMVSRARSVCIQCSSCTQLCPRHLLGHPLEPHRIMRRVAMGGPLQALLGEPEIQNAQLCCECGVCEVYACPMGLFPRKINQAIKRELAAAGIRRPVDVDGACHPRTGREERKAPSQKVAARAGVGKYDGYELRELLVGQPDRVEIPLKIHIGAPAVPVVAAGDRVAEGRVVALPPEEALGAAVHASITGRVASVGVRIVIVKE